MSLPARHETVSADTFLRGLWQENPVFVMLLGMCPVLAVTNSAINALAMGLATTFVLLCSSALVSLLRKQIPKQVRIATYILIIATFVTMAGFTIALLCLGAVREILGAGSLFGVQLFSDNFQPWVVMILPPGGFFVLGAWLLVFAGYRQRRERRLTEQAEVTADGR